MPPSAWPIAAAALAAAPAAGAPPQSAPAGLSAWTLAAALLLVTVPLLLWVALLVRRLRRLQAGERQLQTLVASMPAALVTADEKGRIESFNPAAERIFGYRAEEVVGENVRILMPEPHRSRHDDYMQRYLDTGEARLMGLPGYEVSGRHRDGHAIPLKMSLSEVRVGGRRQFISILRDVSAQKEIEGRLEDESRFANAVINSLPGAFYLLDRVGRCLRWNRNLEEITGYSGEEIAAMRPTDYFRPEDQQRAADTVARVFEEGSDRIEADLVTKSGATIPFLWTGARVDLEGEPCLAGMGMDISDRKALEDELTRRATTDALTGVPNRPHFEQHLDREMAKAARYGRGLSLIMFDLDHFKGVNDHNGHEVGDEVLRQAVTVAWPLLRGSDLLARWGGEEFMVLASETGGEGALGLAERLRAAVEAHPFPGDGEDLTASFGVAEFQADDTPGQLVRRVDAALYRAKRQGRNRVETAPPESSPAGSG
ncbi:MAG TPA: PAS domain S-box protein [Gammaproteobacteria bacterium]|nr:PAS domain S-box protein [Gammaproteobacteria bacterium]